MMNRSVNGVTALSLFWLLTATAMTLVLTSGVRADSACTGKLALTEKVCVGDNISDQEKALFELVTKYRAANGKPTVKISPELSLVANRHLLDLRNNLKMLTHSWSDCMYDIANEKTWPCVLEAPKRLPSGYEGEGYETLYRVINGAATPPLAIEAWKKSALHNSIILNLDTFKDLNWDAVGVAIDGQYAALWFGSPKRNQKGFGGVGSGLGVSYDEAIKGLSKLLAIKPESSTIDGGKWLATSPDKKVTLEIFGRPKDISEANVRVSVKLDEDGRLGAKNFAVLNTLLQNILPDWADREAWLNSALKAIGADKTANRAKIVRDITVELQAGLRNSIQLSIKPVKKNVAVEVF